MPSLVDVQARVRQAVTLLDASVLPFPLVGGADPERRLAIHKRHIESSLTAAIRDKFPATEWLIGQDIVLDAARAFVRSHPPQRPCIAEYGEDFPEFVARYERVPQLPYLRSFAELEWLVGQVSIAIDHTPMSWCDVVQSGSEGLLSARVVLQPGVRLLRASWAIDQLMTAYLTGSAPAEFVMEHADIHIELRGARGALEFERVDPATFAFRAALLGHRTLGDAAEAALETDPGFDAGRALAALVSAGLVTDVAAFSEGS